MRKAKQNRQRTTRVKQHTVAERMEMRREKKRSGPCAMRRKERRKEKQEAHAKMLAEQQALYGGSVGTGKTDTMAAHVEELINDMYQGDMPRQEDSDGQ